MTAKEIAIRTIQDLPENVTWEDIQERVRLTAGFIAAVRNGLRELDAGKGIPHPQIRDEVRGWVSA